MGWFNHQPVILSGRNINTGEVIHSSILNRVVRESFVVSCDASRTENAILIQPEGMTLRKYNIWYIQKINSPRNKTAASKVCFSFRTCLMLQKNAAEKNGFLGVVLNKNTTGWVEFHGYKGNSW